MHIVNSYGSPIVLALLYREVAGDNPDEQANIKGSLILMNILLEKCETLQARFEMETHLIGMGILRTTKVQTKKGNFTMNLDFLNYAIANFLITVETPKASGKKQIIGDWSARARRN